MSDRSVHVARTVAGIAVFSAAVLAFTAASGSEPRIITSEASWSAEAHTETQLLYDPEDSGPTIPGIPPGEDPGAYLDTAAIAEINSTPALKPVELTEGLDYAHSAPQVHWTSMDFCHSFTLENTSSEPVEWELSLAVAPAPTWGWQPFSTAVTAPGQVTHSDGKYTFEQGAWSGSSWETVSWDPGEGIWTIRGNTQADSANHSPIPAGETIQAQFCPRGVPEPEPNPALYTWEFGGTPESWGVNLGVRIETSVITSIPWRIYIDLEDYVCGDYLDEGARVRWGDGYIVEPLTGEAHLYSVRLPSADQDSRVRDTITIPPWGDYRHLVAIEAAQGSNLLDHLPPNC